MIDRDKLHQAIYGVALDVEIKETITRATEEVNLYVDMLEKYGNPTNYEYLILKIRERARHLWLAAESIEMQLRREERE